MGSLAQFVCSPITLEDFEREKNICKLEQKDIPLCRIWKNFLKILNKSLEKYLLLGLLVANADFRFFDVGNLSLQFWWKSLRSSGGNFCDYTPHPPFYSLVSMYVLLKMLGNTFNKSTSVIHQYVLSILHTEQYLVSFKLKQNEADGISSCIVKTNDIR